MSECIEGLVHQKVLKLNDGLIYRLQIIDSCKLTCTCDWREWLMDQRKETCQFYLRTQMFWLILQITCKLFTNRSLYLQYDVVQPAVKLPNITDWQHILLISKQTYNITDLIANQKCETSLQILVSVYHSHCTCIKQYHKPYLTEEKTNCNSVHKLPWTFTFHLALCNVHV